jgi:hypothetical protein
MLRFDLRKKRQRRRFKAVLDLLDGAGDLSVGVAIDERLGGWEGVIDGVISEEEPMLGVRLGAQVGCELFRMVEADRAETN